MAGEVVLLDEEHIALLRESVQQLLDICAENEVNVPEDLKEKLLNSIHEKCLARHAAAETQTEFLSQLKTEVDADFKKTGPYQEFADELRKLRLDIPLLDLRVKNGSYKVTQYVTKDPFETMRNSRHPKDLNETEHDDGPKRATQKIKTVRTESPITKIFTCFATCFVQKGSLKKEKKIKTVMDGVNLYFENGKMYLVLGGPGSGKSTLMKMISNTLLINKNCKFDGEVTLSGLSPLDKNTYWTNLVSYIDQIDRLHPFLTVYETLMFAWMCRSGGTHYLPYYGEGPDVIEEVKRLDKEFFVINVILEVLGLKRVENTFVGDKSTVRGVSGGEKKRVTVAEMFTTRTPVICGDEISTGLDAATTYDITRFTGLAARFTKTIKIISLLQPPPETVANFDELILLGDGKIIYSGPVQEVEIYFNSLGYHIPERVDLADWLQNLPTPDGWQYLKNDKETREMLSEAELSRSDAELREKHLSSDEFHKKFYESERGKHILEQINAPALEPTETTKIFAANRYRNDGITSMKLLARREVLLYWRNKYQVKAKIMQTLIVSVMVGTLFFQASTQSIVSVLFLSMFTTGVQAMTQIVGQFSDRSIFYKQQDANFFPTWCYVAGRTAAAVPNALIDALVFGTIVFFLVGLAFNDGASIGNYFIFVLLMFITSLGSGLIFSVFSACLSNVDTAQAMLAVALMLFNVFSGFTVQPDAIPVYYQWFYHINYFAWMFRSFMVNEFQSGKYDGPSGVDGVTEGESILIQYGYVDGNNEPYTFVWTWWGILFTLLYAFLSIIARLYFLNRVRFSTGGSLVDDLGDDFIAEIPESEMVSIPFTRVDLTFKDIHYTVSSSITKEKLELLKGVDGVVEAGKMTALMGSSGAGKTTIMDVIAMRKNTGEITGEIRLNGHLQEEISFRRCMGYVEQFDQQSPQLTIKETCEFSAKLRLDSNDPAVTPENIVKFVQQALNMLELTNVQDLQVGSDSQGGLSFEQRKRLSIAVELVSNPSILFLDEPTSGLDARAAGIIVRGLKRVAASGRAVCATIHQPSIAVFNEFDRLLLLKTGGEVVFYGDIGTKSSHLIDYFERYHATPKIQPGENPATWMLTTVGGGSNTGDQKQFDYAGSYRQSKLVLHCHEQIDVIAANATETSRVTFQTKYATSWQTQAKAVLQRIMTVYVRSPSYNTLRVAVACIIALIFASVFASQRIPANEADMNSRINSIFMAVLFMCVSAENTILALFECERNMFYRHKAANMYDSFAIVLAFTLAEQPFLLLVTTIFTVIFYFILGFAMDAAKFFIFYAFLFMTNSLFTFLGQTLIAVFKDQATAQGYGGLVIVFTSLFSGVLIRPDQIPNFWIFMYWITPGHYSKYLPQATYICNFHRMEPHQFCSRYRNLITRAVYESLFTSQFSDDQTVLVASVGSPFYESLGCSPEDTEICEGTISQWMTVNFADFSTESIKWNALFLIGLIVAVRLITLYALTSINHSTN